MDSRRPKRVRGASPKRLASRSHGRVRSIADSVSIRAAELMLQTLEESRSQMTAKSTVCAAAASGIIVVTLQFVFEGRSAPWLPSAILGLGALVTAAAALLQGLNIIRKLGRKDRLKGGAMPRNRKHLFYFGSHVKSTCDETQTRFRCLDERMYLKELSEQTVSLSRNLRQRYDALAMAYRFTGIAVVLFVLAIAINQTHEVLITGQTPDKVTTTSSKTVVTTKGYNINMHIYVTTSTGLATQVGRQ